MNREVGNKSGKISCVLFDAGGVLVTLGETNFRKEVSRLLGLTDIPPDYNTFVPALQRGEISEEEVWRQFTDPARELPPFEEIFTKHFPPQEQMIHFAAELRGRGLQTAILSNTVPSHVRAMKRMGFLEGFDPVFFSCEIGHQKPESAVYRHVLDELGLPANEVLFVDDVREYVEAAQREGIHAVHHQGDVEATRLEVLNMIGW